jgi:hypothetical protein
MGELSTQVTVEQRRFTRVIFSRSAKLICGQKTFVKGLVHNLSIGGLFLEGQYDVNVKELCELELHETGRHSCLILTFQAQVVRIEPHAIALQFLDMPLDSYKFLQTMVLYSTEDPYGVSLEFLEDFPVVAPAVSYNASNLK